MVDIVIVESPSKAKTIEKYLGPGFKVIASFGHIRDLPTEVLGVDPQNYRLTYKILNEERFAKLKAAVSGAGKIYLATDPDREGEAIAWHLAQVLKIARPIRIKFHEVTEPGVKSGMANAGDINMSLVHAQEARRGADRLIGWQVSPILSELVGQTVGAGRVQSPALRIVVERERAISEFRPTTHYGARLLFGDYSADWQSGEGYILDRVLAEEASIIRDLVVQDYNESDKRKSPPPAFSTSALQQAAGPALGLNPDAVMSAAQKLFEGGAITYHRTDSLNLSDEAVSIIRDHAVAEGLAVPPKPRVFKGRDGAQEAHEAIRPTDITLGEAGETDAEKALYKLIWSRALASQLDDAVYSVREARLKSSNDTYIYVARGRTLTAPGWQAVYRDHDDKEEAANPVPVLVAGAPLKAVGGEVVEKKTKAPPRFTQSSLVGELERHGIGRPATYASILKNILTREYLIEDPKSRFLSPTAIGNQIVEALVDKFSFVNIEYTSQLEAELDKIALGEAQYLPVVARANENLLQEIDVLKGTLLPKHLCPSCNRVMKRRPGKAKGEFWWGCSGYPDCKHVMSDDAGSPVERAPLIAANDVSKRIYYDVAFDKKDKAKELGLYFDGIKKAWFAPSPEVAAKVKMFKVKLIEGARA
jgi:DNA topoisomerase-1